MTLEGIIALVCWELSRRMKFVQYNRNDYKLWDFGKKLAWKMQYFLYFRLNVLRCLGPILFIRGEPDLRVAVGVFIPFMFLNFENSLFLTFSQLLHL